MNLSKFILKTRRLVIAISLPPSNDLWPSLAMPGWTLPDKKKHTAGVQVIPSVSHVSIAL